MASIASAVIGRAGRVGLGELNLDQLRQERQCHQVVPAELVQAAMQPGRGEGGLSASHVQGDHGLDGPREIFIAAKKFVGLFQPSLGYPELG